MQNNNASDNVTLNICLLHEITFKCIYYEIEKVLQFCHCKYNISRGSLKSSVCAARNALRKQGMLDTQITPTLVLVPKIGLALLENPKHRACEPMRLSVGQALMDIEDLLQLLNCLHSKN